MYVSYHLHTDVAPFCQSWTETYTYFHPYETAEAQRKRQRLPKKALVGPFYYEDQKEWKLCPHKLAAEGKD